MDYVQKSLKQLRIVNSHIKTGSLGAGAYIAFIIELVIEQILF